ncbi:MAG TPA: acetyl ornithine aminotransferase family protein [Anaerolineae bacterium]|nr:acetyl ornithine aminotransferase family protein [Anaerolineae bacterium]HPL28625.1 acetyl ornithine aminotransferase family protein [Anaerolineae bacterium]
MSTQTSNPTSCAGSDAEHWVARDAAVLSPSYTRSYPFVMDRGRGSEVWDIEGRRYIDMNSGIAVCATGHCHPDVVRAIQRQAERFLHMSGTDFYYPLEVEVAERLDRLVPGDEPHQAFLCNSGAEAVEAAFKLARYATGRPRMLAFMGAFHGRTMGSLSLTASKSVQRAGFEPLVPGVSHVPYAYCYRCPYHLQYPACDLACVSFIEKTLFKTIVPPREVAAIFVEPIQGEGGYVVPPPEFHPRLKELAERYGILYVDDEIQAGLGRTGRMFAIEHWGVVPDIVTIAKGIASGLPLGAAVARKSLMTWVPGSHGNTFGGNPLACAAALETLRLVESEFMANAAAMGEVMMERLRGMQRRCEQIGDVRGMGLMVGIELVKDQAGREPAPELRDAIVQAAFERGLLLLGCGTSTVRFCPALNIPRAIVDEALNIFEEALHAALSM